MTLDRSADPARGVRARIVDVASELFYRDGIRAVGIDTVIARARVAKASLYHHFRTKDELTAAVLRRRDERWRAWLAQTVDARGGSPDTRLLAVFDALAEWFATDGFRGCGFINAAAEFPDPDHPVRAVVREHKDAVVDYLRALTNEAGIDDPEACASELFLLMEGAIVTAYIENDAWPAGAAKAAAAAALRGKATSDSQAL
jgi:AcrR family transcriptional regulator